MKKLIVVVLSNYGYLSYNYSVASPEERKVVVLSNYGYLSYFALNALLTILNERRSPI